MNEHIETEEKPETTHCRHCGKEISQQEAEENEGYCSDCYEDLMDEDFLF